MKSDDASRRRGRWLTERDVGDSTSAAEDAESSPSAAGVIGETIDDISGGGDLEDMRAEDVGTIASEDNGRFGLVFGSRRTATRAAKGGVLVLRGISIIISIIIIITIVGVIGMVE